MEAGRICVVGASLAGLRAIEALRERGFDGVITWIGAEAELPYDRPPLSKQVLRGEWNAERVRLPARPSYDELRLDLRLGRRAARLDTTGRTLHLDDGEALPFSRLVISTGASPRTLPGSLPAGVHTLRTLGDALAIREALVRGPRVAIVGAGFIGLEVAASCRALGLDVTIVEAAHLPLPQLGPVMGKAVVELHRDHGVALRLGVKVDAVLGERDVRGLRLSDDTTVEADLVIVGIGVAPETAWLGGSGVVVDDGVRCDATGATSVPGIVACGDVARWDNPLYGDARRVEHWTSAVEQAHVAAARLVEDAPPPLRAVPYFWSDQYDCKLQFAGRVLPGDALQVLEGSLAGRSLVALYGRAGQLSGVLAVNRPAQLIRYKKAILAGAPFS